MRVSLLLFIAGVALIIAGYGNQLKASQCSNKPIVKYVPRDVYDELMMKHNVMESPATDKSR